MTSYVLVRVIIILGPIRYCMSYIARISFRDIGAILNKASEDKKAEQRKEQHQDGTEKNQVQLSYSVMLLNEAEKLYNTPLPTIVEFPALFRLNGSKV